MSLWTVFNGSLVTGLHGSSLPALIRDVSINSNNPANYLVSAYPLPRNAVVSDGPLLVRQGPSTADEYIGMLTAGQDATVDQFSEDGNWSHITRPAVGWVSNQYLYFNNKDAAGVSIRLTVRRQRVGTGDVGVRSGPGSDYPQAGVLSSQTSILIIATTADNSWMQLAEPITGWVTAEHILQH